MDKTDVRFIEETVAEVREDFLRRQQARRSVELAWRLNMNFVVGNQYSEITPRGEIDDFGKQYYWQEREVFNHIAPIVETRLAKLTRVRSGVTVRPNTSDEDDVSSAKFSTAVLESITAENNLSQLMQLGNTWSEICGSVFYKIAWNSDKGKVLSSDGKKPLREGDVEITVCPPFEIYPEVLQISEISHQPSLIHAKAYPVDEIAEIWGVTVEPEKVNVFTMDNATVTGGFGYATTVPRVTDETKTDYALVIEKYQLPTSEYPDGRLIIVAGDKLLYHGILPYLNGEQGGRTYPFIKQNSLENVGAFFGASVVERCIPVQRAYNAVKNRKHEYLNRISMGVLAVEDGSVDTDNLSEEGLCPGKILVYRQGSTPPVMMNAGSVPADFHIEEERLLQEFAMISGVSEVMKYSQLPENVSSGTAIALLIEQDDTRLAITSNNLRNAVREIGKHILRLYKQFAVGKRLKRIAGENGEVEMLYFCGSDISSDDIVFDTENDLSDTPANRKNMVMELLKLGLLSDENGRVSPRNKAKILEIIGLGNWENSKDIEDLNIKKAVRENIAMRSGEQLPDKTDDHHIHVAEHKKFILAAEFDGDNAVKRRVIEHIDMHNQYAVMINTTQTEGE